MQDTEEEEVKKEEKKEEEPILIHVIEYNREIDYLEAQMKIINATNKKIAELQENNKKRAERYLQRVNKLREFPDDPEKWYEAEIKETEKQIRLALGENVLSVYNDGLTTVDFMPQKIVRKVDPNDDNNERTYELKWHTLHAYMKEILVEFNESHPKFTYEIDLVHEPEKQCEFCLGLEEGHCCKAKDGLIRIKKNSMKISSEYLPPVLPTEEEEEKVKENDVKDETTDKKEDSQLMDEDQFVCVEQEGKDVNKTQE